METIAKVYRVTWYAKASGLHPNVPKGKTVAYTHCFEAYNESHALILFGNKMGVFHFDPEGESITVQELDTSPVEKIVLGSG